MSVTASAVSATWRIEAPRLLGGLIRFTQSVDLAEDLAQEALLAALEKWPETGIPENPGAWLMQAAKNRAIDWARHKKTAEHKHVEIGREALLASEPTERGLGDDVLRLMLIACHPVLTREGRVALTLRLLGGLSTDEIARAFLTPEPTMAQRIVRAKKTIGAARVPFEVPEGDGLFERLPSVLEVIYLIFNEGYAAAAGDDWMRPDLCREAMRLGRMVAALVPEDAEAHGLVSLMELQASRMRARVDKKGRPVLLLDQDRARWDHALIRHGLAFLERAESLQKPSGPYTLQAAIAACHARAARPETTDWARIVALYDALLVITESPVVALNRAVATSMAYGAEEGLRLVDDLVRDGSLENYALLYAARADLVLKLGRDQEALADLRRAHELTENQAERMLLAERILLLKDGRGSA